VKAAVAARDLLLQRELVLRAILSKIDEIGIEILGWPEGLKSLFTEPIGMWSWSDVDGTHPRHLVARLASAVYEKGGTHLLLFSPLEGARLEAVDFDKAAVPGQARDSLLGSVMIALDRCGCFQGVPEPAAGEEQVTHVELVGDVRDKLWRVELVPPPEDTRSKGVSFDVMKQTAGMLHVPQLPGTPGVELLSHPSQSPMQKLVSHMAAESAAEIAVLKFDVMEAKAEQWATEQYPLGAFDEFKSKEERLRYDEHMRVLRELLVVDSLYGEEFPVVARARLSSLRQSIEHRAVTQLAYGQSEEAGKVANMVLGKATSSFLGRYQDQIATVMSSVTESQTSAAHSKKLAALKASVGKVAAKVEADNKSVERLAKRAKASKQVQEAEKSAGAEPGSKKSKVQNEFEDCSLCGNSHRGGEEQCAFNPRSQTYNSVFGKYQRARKQGQAPSNTSTASEVFSRQVWARR
jgi:hypothetical protein